MMLRGIDYGFVFGASGMGGVFGEGYSYHRLLRPLGVRFDEVTLVTRTTTLYPRPGHMPMKEDGITPIERIPRCIRVYPIKAVVLNSVGFSGPGAEALFETGRWQKITKPFFLSFGFTADCGLAQLKIFVEMFKKYLPEFQADVVGVQLNVSCPNVGLDQKKVIDDVREALYMLATLGIPIMLKFSVITPVEVVKEICAHPECDAIHVSNTVPWGMRPNDIDWRGLSRRGKSPLVHLGGGGLSGKPLFPLVVKWVREARKIGIIIPINAGGGILGPNYVDVLQDAGASSISIGSIVMLRPWLFRATIRRAWALQWS